MSARGSGRPKQSGKKKPAEAVKPTGPVPTSAVIARHSGGMVSRGSRGFSKGEVEGAGLPVSLARKWRLPMDTRRRSVLDGNVTSIQMWMPRAKPAKKPEGEVKRFEEDLGKIEKEVKKEANKLKKEVAKVEQKAFEKVEAPVKARTRKKKTSKAST